MDEYKKLCMADGGEVKNQKEESFLESIRSAFKPSPTPDPEIERQQRYEKIREENRLRMEGKLPVGSANYYDGGKVDPVLAEMEANIAQLKRAAERNRVSIGSDTILNNDNFKSSHTLSPNMGDKQLSEDYHKTRKYAQGGLVQNLAGGGKVLSPEEFEQHILDLQNKGIKTTDVNLEPGSTITANLGKAPALPQESFEVANPDEQAVESPYAAEEFDATEKALADGHQHPSQKQVAEQPVEEVRAPASEPNPSELLAKLGTEQSQPNKLADAQSERDMNIAGQRIQKGAALFGAGAARTNPDDVMKVINDGDKYVNLPVQKYDEQIANQQNDPSSPMSSVVREYLASKGFKVPDSASAADILKVAPYLAKDEALKAAMQRSMMNIEAANKRSEADRQLRESEGQKNRENALKAAGMRASAIERGQNKADERQSKRMAAQIVQRVNMDPIAKPSMMNLASLAKSKAILENKSIPLTPQLLSDAEQDISSALTLRGMGATEGKIKRTELVTLGRLVAEAKQKWGNNPGIDLRKTDPELVRTIEKMNQGLIDDYKITISERKQEIASEYGEALGDDGRIAKTLDQYKKEPKESFIERLDPKTGKTAIFDANTKQFVKWKE